MQTVIARLAKRGAVLAVVIAATALASGCHSGNVENGLTPAITGPLPPPGGGGTTPPPGGGGGGGTTPPPGGGGGTTTGGTSTNVFVLDPEVTRPENIWHLDVDTLGNGAIWFANMVGHGLADQNAGEADPANLAAKDKIVGAILRRVSTAYLRTDTGRKVSGRSINVCFVGNQPAGTAGVDFSRICLGSRESFCASGTLGVEILDFGNRDPEGFCELNRLGTFAGRICGLNSELGNGPRGGGPFTVADAQFVNGNYRLGQGSAAEDNRFTEINEVIDDWGTSIGSVVAHEIGHSMGLEHDNSGANIMIAVTNPRDMSDPTNPFTQRSLQVLANNCGISP